MAGIKLGFIGGGNMASSIIGGLVDDSAYEIYVADPDHVKLNQLKKDFEIQICDSNQALIEKVDVVVLAVKPQLMQRIVEPLKDAYTLNSPLIISIAAGIQSHQILNWIGRESAAFVRVMPNTPALVQSGASGLFAVNTSAQQQQIATNIMNAVGISIWLDNEDLIDSVTAVSGSGPAYFFYLMESIYDSALKNGLEADTAKALTLQTALGAAKLAAQSDNDFATLRQQVTSPGGTTEAAVNVLKEHGFLDLVDKAVSQAAIRSKELAKG